MARTSAAIKKATEGSMDLVYLWGLTFDMSDAEEAAKLVLGHLLDGRV